MSSPWCHATVKSSWKIGSIKQQHCKNEFPKINQGKS